MSALTLLVPSTATQAATSTVLFSSATPGFVPSAATVPVGACFVTVTADGGHGGASTSWGTAGGSGASVSARVPVTAGLVLAAQVGGAGGTDSPSAGGDGGAGGGGGGGLGAGGGGGASVVSIGGTPFVVAGGGGAGGNQGTGAPAGLPAGGNGDGTAAGVGGSADPAIGGGGGGGGVTGGGSGSRVGGGGNGLVGGGGGTVQVSGGPGGSGLGFGGPAGGPTLRGGRGGNGNTTGGNGGGGSSTSGGGGGGGGIGFGGGAGGSLGYGGGGAGYGGGAGTDGSNGFAGGGGGSSYAAPAATSVAMTPSSRSGDGQVTISYDPVADACASPDLTVTKTAETTFAQGGAGVYTLVVNNIGTGPTTAGYVLTDTMPAGLTITTIAAAGTWDCAASTSTTVSCTSASGIAAGGSADPVTVAVDIAADAPASITNTATVSGGGETDASNDDGSATVSVSSWCLPGSYSPTGTAPCTIAPPGTFVDTAGALAPTPCMVGSFNGFSGAISCTLAPPGSYVDTLRAQVPTACAVGTFSSVSGASSCTMAAIGSYVDSTGASSQTACPTGTTTSSTGSISAAACTPIPRAPVFTMNTPPSTATVGQPYGYTFVATGVPAPTYGLVAAPSWLGIEPSTGLVSGTPPTGTTTFTYRVVATNGATPDATAGPFTVAVTTPPPPSTRADLATTLSCPSTARVSTIVTCTFTVRNNGPASAKSIVAVLEVPDEFVLTSISPSGTSRHDVVMWRAASLGSGSWLTFTITAKAARVGRHEVEAAAASSSPDPNWRNNLVEAVIRITR